MMLFLSGMLIGIFVEPLIAIRVRECVQLRSARRLKRSLDAIMAEVNDVAGLTGTYAKTSRHAHDLLRCDQKERLN